MDIIYTFPGDRPTRARLLYGYEFRQQNAAPTSGNENEEGSRYPISTTVLRPGPDILCDTCNAKVGALDPCVQVSGRLYCWRCAPEGVLQYAAPNAVELACCLMCGMSPCDEEECGAQQYACPECNSARQTDPHFIDDYVGCSLCEGTGTIEIANPF